MEVLLDERPIFKGEIQKAPGVFFWFTRFLNLKNTPSLLTTTQHKKSCRLSGSISVENQAKEGQEAIERQ